jgi:hypothetical protein
MTIGAELTLQISRRVQAHARAELAEFPRLWSLWPRGERLDWDGTRALLDSLPKPLLVAPLLEPGMLGLWEHDPLDEQRRPIVRYGIKNQVQYYADKLAAIGAERGPVRFGPSASRYEMTRDEFLLWATEYAINVGISLEPADDAGVALVRIRPSAGGPPLTL